jgi:hypothetical protein
MKQESHNGEIEIFLEKFQCNVKIHYILSLRNFSSKRLQQAQGNGFIKALLLGLS